jgi:hypothetical protein
LVSTEDDRGRRGLRVENVRESIDLGPPRRVQVRLSDPRVSPRRVRDRNALRIVLARSPART